MGGIGMWLRAVPVALLLANGAMAQDAAAPATPAVPAVPAMPETPVDPATAAAWQDVITGQIEAFRAHDATGAFQYAAAPFQAAFPSAEAFFVAIIGSGYQPIMESASHSFGSFTQLDPKSVAQIVVLTAKDLSRYEAVYILRQEEKGWRVAGVQLARKPGIAI